MKTLVLVAHGSHLNANSARAAQRYARQIQAARLYDEVRLTYWKEEPSLRQILRTVPGQSVTILPVFMSEGYFTETVIPRELGLAHQGPVPASGIQEQVGGKDVLYLPPYGTHPAMREVILARAHEVLPDLNAHDTALIVLGHGTTENDHSREAIARNAKGLRRSGLFAEVHDFYLDEEPRVSGWAASVKAPRVIIVPFFASEGWHTQETIPQELKLQGEATHFATTGQTVYYARPVGTHPSVAGVILELAAQAREHAPASNELDQEVQNAWQEITRQAQNGVNIGEIHVRQVNDQVVLRHAADQPGNLHPITELSELPGLVTRTQDGKHRPIRSLRTLQRGWQATLPATQLPEALRLLSPALVEETHLHHLGKLPVTPWPDTATRQTGLYRTVREATPQHVAAEVQSLCRGCLRTPLWSGATLPEPGYPCAEACTLLVAHVRDRLNEENPHRRPPARAFVSLVGAGPGDAGLLTLKGLQVLQQADVVLYDALVSPELLLHAPSTELIHVGKRGFRESTSQDDINTLMVQKAVEGEGKRVVRLKGGDPFVFGRGGEEAAACRAAQVPFEVVPGISSALAGPAYAGIPVTHRGVARSFAVLTGTEQDGPARYRELSSVDTLVFLMALNNLEQICADLIAAGRHPDTPVATIASATLPTQKVVTGTLTSIAGRVRQEKIKAPALTVVGDVVKLRGTLDWFTPPAQSLAGLKVVVTRTRQTPSTLADLLRHEGAQVTELPLLRFEPSHSPKTVIGALRDHQGWVTLTSEQAVSALFEVLHAHNLDARTLAGVKVAAVGQGTARALMERGLKADFVPSRSGAKHLGAGLPAQPGELVLHLGPQHEDETLRNALAARDVDYLLIETFREETHPLNEQTEQALQQAHAITLASAAGARHFARVAGTDWPVTVIGPQTAQAARQAGFTSMNTAQTATLEGLTLALQVPCCESG